MNQTNRIFIISHFGAGKGVLTQAIAEKLGWQFIIADVMGCASNAIISLILSV